MREMRGERRKFPQQINSAERPSLGQAKQKSDRPKATFYASTITRKPRFLTYKFYLSEQRLCCFHENHDLWWFFIMPNYSKLPGQRGEVYSFEGYCYYKDKVSLDGNSIYLKCKDSLPCDGGTCSGRAVLKIQTDLIRQTKGQSQSLLRQEKEDCTYSLWPHLL